MFYDPRAGLASPLKHNPINVLVAPRPIGWISTVSRTGAVNLAPFSYFNAVSADPAMVMFAPNEKASGGQKDTYLNLLDVPEFVASVVSAELSQAMNQTSAELERGRDEFDFAGLDRTPSVIVRPPRVTAARAALECEVHDVIELPAGASGRRSHLVIGQVVGIYIADDCIRDGGVDQLLLAQVARLGRNDYTIVRELFGMPRP
ncbi:MAG: flavin reductase family protein [Gammaproteobacteria bacterium]|nr:flavin reductase family protein [Gammaproteobacteria bacterium]